jgi:hypothetical protein
LPDAIIQTPIAVKSADTINAKSRIGNRSFATKGTFSRGGRAETRWRLENQSWAPNAGRVRFYSMPKLPSELVKSDSETNPVRTAGDMLNFLGGYPTCPHVKHGDVSVGILPVTSSSWAGC